TTRTKSTTNGSSSRWFRTPAGCLAVPEPVYPVYPAYPADRVSRADRELPAHPARPHLAEEPAPQDPPARDRFLALSLNLLGSEHRNSRLSASRNNRPTGGNSVPYTAIEFFPGPRVASIALNHPPLNIITIAMLEELNAALNEVDDL